MAHFCMKHNCDNYLCQICLRIKCEMCDGQHSTWMKIPGQQFSGNVCPDCKKQMDKEGK